MEAQHLATLDQVHAANNAALDSLLVIAKNTSDVLPDEGTATAALNYRLNELNLEPGQVSAMLCQLAIQVARGR